MNLRNDGRHLLARSAVAQVEYCVGCEVFHLSMDVITLRLRVTALKALRDTLTTALAQYEHGLRTADSDAPVRIPEGMH